VFAALGNPKNKLHAATHYLQTGKKTTKQRVADGGEGMLQTA
jgi:hypothetical protein